MRASRLLCIPLAIAGLALAPQSAWAQQPGAVDAATAQAIRQEMTALRAEFDARMTALEARLAGTPSGTVTPPSADLQAPPTSPSGGLPTPSSNVFNPDMAVIGNVLGAAGKNNINPQPGFELHETEITLQSIVDPYARADFFLSVGPGGAEVEEGFITFPTLPGGFLVKAGKMRTAFGRINALHPHVLPWTDRPLVTANLTGGEEGINDAGLSVARLIPNPWFFLEATGQVFSGNSGDVFQASERGDVSFVGRLRGYQDISESTNVDIGASYAHGHNDSGVVSGVDVGRFTTELFGVDAAIRWKPLQRSIYRSFIARAEGVLSRRDQPGGRQSATGFFVSGDYQLARRWFSGVRFDASERATNQSMKDTGQSIVLTFRPSEFSEVRGQLRRTRFAEGVTANEFLFQFQFSIGAHGAHPFQ